MGSPLLGLMLNILLPHCFSGLGKVQLLPVGYNFIHGGVGLLYWQLIFAGLQLSW